MLSDMILLVGDELPHPLRDFHKALASPIYYILLLLAFSEKKSQVRTFLLQETFLLLAMNGEELLVVDDNPKDGKESSSSGSTGSGSSSSGDESSSSSSAESTSKTSSVWKEDEVGEYLLVTCAENEAKFYKDRFARGSIGKCVWFKGRWITPNEFQAVSGRQSSKDWKRSIRLNGRCLKEYISEGLFQEHTKSCSCSICQGEDEDLKRQEGFIALAAKRRRLSQAGVDSSHGGPSHLQQGTGENEAFGGGGAGEESGDSEGQVEGMTERRLPGTDVKRKKRCHLLKNQRVWSPSGGIIYNNEYDRTIGIT